MTQDEAEKLARELLPSAGYHDAVTLPIWAGHLRRLCDHILSGDHKREIENAAYERAISLCHDYQSSGWSHDRRMGASDIGMAIRALIQPAA